MNKKQIKDYIADPNHCPFCNSEDIEAGDYDFEDR
jgi:predicted Zn-ribbon and HTH transcriptional regulator